MFVSRVTHPVSSIPADPCSGEVHKTIQDDRIARAAERGLSILAPDSHPSLLSRSSCGTLEMPSSASPSPWGTLPREGSSLLGGASPSPYTHPGASPHPAPCVPDLMDLLTEEGSRSPGAMAYTGNPIDYIASLFPTPKHKSL
jgi:hypothetical protein